MAEELIHPAHRALTESEWNNRARVPFADPPLPEASAQGCVRFDVPWPRWPLVTSTGKPSHAKTAGQLVPWLSMNRVNNMHRRVHQGARIEWRQATVEELECFEFEEMNVPVRIILQLYRVSSPAMDVGAVVEGAKPIIDGMVRVGLLAGDSPYHVTGIDALPVVNVGRKGAHRVKVIVCTHPIAQHKGATFDG